MSNVCNITGGNNDSLLRTLRLLQSREGETEEKLASAGASNGDLVALLVRNSVALSVHWRWVMMLEAENSLLKGAAARVLEPAPDDIDEEEEAAAPPGGVAAWWVALAVCVSITSVGLALGRFLG